MRGARAARVLVVTDATGTAEARVVRDQGVAALAGEASDEASGEALIIDFSAATVVGGAMQQALLSLHKEAQRRGRTLALRGLSAAAETSFGWTGLGEWARQISVDRGSEREGRDG